jgi:hypothetical protein
MALPVVFLTVKRASTSSPAKGAEGERVRDSTISIGGAATVKDHVEDQALSPVPLRALTCH